MGQILVRTSVPKKANARPSVRYTARVRLKGVTRCKTFRTETQAKDWIEKEEAKIKREDAEGTLIRGHFTVADAVKLYQEHKLEHIATKAWNSILKIIVTYMGEVELGELKQSDILNARNAYRKSRTPFLANSTCNKFTTCLRNVLKLARKFEMIGHDPFREFERLDEKAAARTRYLKDDEREALFAEIKKSKNPHLWAIVNVAIMTGFRKNTIRFLRWSEIDLVKNMIRLSNASINEERKRGKPRSPNVPIVPSLKAILEEHKQKYGNASPLLFPSPTDPNKPISFRSAWDVAVRNANLADFKFHDLRHTTGTYLGRMRVPLHIIQQILGHSDPKMSMRYITTVDETVSEEMARVFNFNDVLKDGTSR